MPDTTQLARVAIVAHKENEQCREKHRQTGRTPSSNSQKSGERGFLESLASQIGIGLELVLPRTTPISASTSRHTPSWGTSQ